MSADDRVTLRIEKEDADVIDAFLQEATDLESRSQLFRVAVLSYIHQESKSGPQVPVKLPKKFLDLIDTWVDKGYYNSREDAVVDAVRGFFTRSRARSLKEQTDEIDRQTGKLVEVGYGSNKEVLPR